MSGQSAVVAALDFILFVVIMAAICMVAVGWVIGKEK